MKSVMSKVASLLFWLFALVAFCLMVTLTYSAIMKIFPGDPIKAIWGVSMFDVACVVWLLTFAFKSKGIQQRAGALLNFLLALAGTLAMVALEVLIGGQDLVTVSADMGEKVVYLFIGITVANLVGIYWHHLTEPEVADEIEQQSEVDKVTEQARRQASEIVRSSLPQLGAVIAARQVADVYTRLGLAQSNGQVIDAIARDVAAPATVTPAPRPGGFRALLGRLKPAPKNDKNDLSQAVPVEMPAAYEAEKGGGKTENQSFRP